MNNISNRLKYLRKNAKLTQAGLADELFISRSHITNLEKSKSNITSDIIDLYSGYFNVPKIYFQQIKFNQELQHQLEKIYDALLMNNSDNLVNDFFKERIYEINTEQEISYLLLYIVYLNRKNKYDQATAIENKFLYEIFKEVEEENLIKTFIPYKIFKMDKLRNEFKKEACIKLIDSFIDSEFEIRHYIRWNNIKAQFLYQLGKNIESYSLINEMVKQAEKIDDSWLIITSKITLSSILSKLKSYRERLDILKSININKYENDSKVQALVYQHFGSAYKGLNKLTEAVKNFEMSNKLANNLPSNKQTLVFLITTNIQLEKFIDAKKWLKTYKNYVLNKREQMVAKSLTIEIDSSFEGYKIKNNDIKQLINYFEHKNEVDDLKYIYKYLAKYYYKIKNYKVAADYMLAKEKL